MIKRYLLLVAGLIVFVVLVRTVFAHPSLHNNAVYVVACTSNQALPEPQSGSLFTNLGAGGAVTLDLPPAQKSLYYIVSLAAAQDVNVDVAAGDQILGLTSSVGDQISSDAAIGSTVELVAIDSTNWLPIRTTGTWTDAN